ncbi:TetR/AcrR family transcriptional regulator [Blastococcus tunisiensis]|uniref:TetR/AcrR family transcriptional regulator n=1 Tax=Blastococcus tunisiensis TaxID=1798228 RepID=UPI000B810F5A|nr:TetR/AcrR family transcriptional regulator [Blastococcus sp. DSM 46838]
MSRREQILAVAESVLEAEGPASLTMRRLATELGIRAPSLYKHVRSKDDIEAGLQERALRGIGEAVAAAGPELSRLTAAYRAWATAHPRLYELATRRPLHREALGPDVEESAAAPLVAAAGGDEHLARAMWATAHGLVDLELARRFPPGADIDRAWRVAFEALAPRTRPARERTGLSRDGSATVAPSPAPAGRGTPPG